MLKQAAAAISINEARLRANSPSKRLSSSADETPIYTNIFQCILSSNKLPPSEKQQDRIAQEGFAFLAGGSDTTARVLTTATYHLLANRDTVLSRLRNELKAAMVDPYMRIDVKTLEQLPWLVSFHKWQDHRSNGIDDRQQ